MVVTCIIARDAYACMPVCVSTYLRHTAVDNGIDLLSVCRAVEYW